MFPTVGLYLPNTLHRTMETVADRPATANSKRHITHKASFDRPRTVRTSLSTEQVNDVYPSVSTALRFANFVSGLSEASSEIRALVTVLQRVGEDISLALRLRNSSQVQLSCQSRPDERNWIDNVLLDVQSAINDIGVFVENVRVSGDEGGEVTLKQKFNWVLSHHHKVRDRQATLLICHQSLSTAINYMQMIKMGEFPQELQGDDPSSIVYEAPVRPWLDNEDNDLLRGPYMRQKHRRRSQRNLSVPSITVSEFEDKKKDGSVAVLEPVELPGSTPEDLPDPDNLDLYSLPSKPQTTVRQAATLPPTIDTVNLENVTESDTSPKTPKHADTVPLLGRRYRARRVLVPAAPPGKHRSLPVQLPYIPQTPSLASDLSGWMSEPENEHTTAMMESPVSDASSPKAPSAAVPLAHRATSFESVTTSTSIATISNAEASDHAASSKLEQTSTSMSQESSLEPSLGRSSIESSISMTSPKAYKSPHVDASNHYIQKETHSDVVSQNHLVELPTEREAPPEQPLSAPAQPKTQNQPDTQALPVQSKPVPAMPVTPASVQALGTPGQDQPEPNENQPKPMTSQAKRRAAHARRMRVAYG